ncbi:MAG: guanylate kinase [Erysipelotrichaceae bacterium]|jgi:guanylate kinase|nr:guanylate kinase [Bacillota bacterium]NLJ32285.1 guanylate kinase [Erysipelotrichaceae bacterium]
MKTKKGLIIVLSGPSGVGKGTVRKKLMENEDLKLVFSISMTTRLPRQGEKDGVDYFFVTEEVFDQNLKNNNFLEHATFVNNRYGTPKDYVEKLLDKGYNVFIEIDVQGALQVKENVKGDNLVLVFLIPPSIEELENRIRSRGTEEEATIQKRLKRAKEELIMQKHYDFIVINDTVEQAAKDIEAIILNKLK